MVLIPATEDKNPFTILMVALFLHGVYEGKRLWQHVM